MGWLLFWGTGCFLSLRPTKRFREARNRKLYWLISQNEVFFITLGVRNKQVSVISDTCHTKRPFFPLQFAQTMSTHFRHFWQRTKSSPSWSSLNKPAHNKPSAQIHPHFLPRVHFLLPNLKNRLTPFTSSCIRLLFPQKGSAFAAFLFVIYCVSYKGT